MRGAEIAYDFAASQRRANGDDAGDNQQTWCGCSHRCRPSSSSAHTISLCHCQWRSPANERNGSDSYTVRYNTVQRTLSRSVAEGFTGGADCLRHSMVWSILQPNTGLLLSNKHQQQTTVKRKNVKKHVWIYNENLTQTECPLSVGDLSSG